MENEETQEAFSEISEFAVEIIEHCEKIDVDPILFANALTSIIYLMSKAADSE